MVPRSNYGLMFRHSHSDEDAGERVRTLIVSSGFAVMVGGLLLMVGVSGVGATCVGLGMVGMVLAGVRGFALSERQRREGRGGYLTRGQERLYNWVLWGTAAWFGFLAYQLATREVHYGLQVVHEPAWDMVGVLAGMWAAFAALMVLFKRRSSRPAGSPPDLQIFVAGLPTGVGAEWGARSVGEAPVVEGAFEGTEFTKLYFADAGPWASEATFARHAAREFGREVLYDPTPDADDDRFRSVLPSAEERDVVWPEGEPPRLATPCPA